MVVGGVGRKASIWWILQAFVLLSIAASLEVISQLVLLSLTYRKRSWGGSNTLIHLLISYFCEKSHEGPKRLKLLLCILGFQISTAFQASHYLLPRKFESGPFWARCLKEIAYRSTLLYMKDIFLKNSVQTYGFNQ